MSLTVVFASATGSADPVLAREYAMLKRRLASRFADDREAYTNAKRQFVHVNSGATRNPLGPGRSSQDHPSES